VARAQRGRAEARTPATRTDAARSPRAGGSPARDELRSALIALLNRPRFEVLPLPGIEEAVLAHLPREGRVTVTASPRRGLEATLSLSERLARHGYTVVPHLSARLVRDRGHLTDALGRLRAAGVRELFVPAGDAREPAGEFHGAADLLEAMSSQRQGFTEIGITGYPESHHLISDEVTIQAMFAKAPMATCIISQICFDAETICAWVARVRARGTHLPIWIGMPGIVDYARLLRISTSIGLGESTRFLRTHGSWAKRLITRRFKPDRLLEQLGPCVTDPGANVAGFHLYTFNEVEGTERWRRQTLERLSA
jgi:methylenetetrahydrofolate reductase (NADH)